MTIDLSVAEKLFDKGKYNKALLVYQELLKQEPENALLHQNLARCLIRLKRYTEAETEAYEALKIDNTLSHPYATLGYLHHVRKEYQSAEEFQRKALELDPHNYRHHANFGLTLLAQEKFDAGIIHLQKAESINAFDPETLYFLSFGYAKNGAVDLALQVAWREFRLRPTIRSLLWLAGRIVAKKPLIGNLINIIITGFLLIAPISLSYSVFGIVVSIIAAIIVISFIGLSIYGVIRSDKIVRNGKPVLVTIFLLSMIIYLIMVYDHWSQPIMSPQNFSVNIDTSRVATQNRKMIGRFSILPPFIRFEEALTVVADISIENHLDAIIECAVLNKDHFVRVGSYRRYAELQFQSGRTNEKITIEYSSSESEIWLVCGNSLSQLAISIDLDP